MASSAAAAAAAAAAGAGAGGEGGAAASAASGGGVVLSAEQVGDTRGALNVSLHPQVILQISAHFTKTSVQTGQSNPRVLGAFVGVQDGRSVEVFMGYELVFDEVEGTTIVDLAHLKDFEDKLKQVQQYKTYDFLGWYTVGAEPGERELAIQQQFIAANETPLLLMVDVPAISAATKTGKVTRELPIHLYESVVRVISGEAAVRFTEANFTIATHESERVAVDQVARASGGGSQLSTHVGSLTGAMRMLNERLKLLLLFIDSVQRGDTEPDLVLLRRIHSLTTQLPTAGHPEFRQDINIEYSDALLTTYLATLTKSAATLSDTVDKFNRTADNGRGGRGRSSAAALMGMM